MRCLIRTHDARGHTTPIEGNALLPLILYVALKRSVKSLKSIATSAIPAQSNGLVAKMVTCNISSLYKQKLI